MDKERKAKMNKKWLKIVNIGKERKGEESWKELKKRKKKPEECKEEGKKEQYETNEI